MSPQHPSMHSREIVFLARGFSFLFVFTLFNATSSVASQIPFIRSRRMLGSNTGLLPLRHALAVRRSNHSARSHPKVEKTCHNVHDFLPRSDGHVTLWCMNTIYRKRCFRSDGKPVTDSYSED